ncbi:hypothetical protein AXK58_22885 [Tsukamurella tyrosinosolvens]|nr:hypothetical protein AXK58_22885 [Tsukamurella tyrosinosolvens]
MVHLHAARAGIAVPRPTSDVDVVVAIGTGGASFNAVRDRIESLGFAFEPPVGDGGAHKFLRGTDRIDLMVADRIDGRRVPRVQGRLVFQVPAGTSALNKAVDCRVQIAGQEPIALRVPNALGALALKGAAYRGDSRESERHLEDAALIACTIDDPRTLAAQLAGSDRARVRSLRDALDERHPAWRPYSELRERGLRALHLLSG